MNLEDRASLAVSEIEMAAEKGKLSFELAKNVVEFHSTGGKDTFRLWNEVLRQLKGCGYDVPDPVPEPDYWSLAGALALFLIVVVLLILLT